MTMSELNNFSLQFQKEVETKVVELGATTLANIISSEIDDLAVFGKETFVSRHLLKEGDEREEAEKKFRLCSIFLHAYMDIRERYFEVQRTSRRDPSIDFECEAVFIPLEDKTLVLFYAERQELNELWKSQQGVEEYRYWDSEEKPKGVKMTDWEERRVTWENVWKPGKMAKDLGLTIVFYRGMPEKHELNEEVILQCFPSFENRLKEVATDKLYDEKYNEWKMKGAEISTINRLVRTWMKSEEGEIALKETMENCRTFILPAITSKNLRQSYEKNHFDLLEMGIAKDG